MSVTTSGYDQSAFHHAAAMGQATQLNSAQKPESAFTGRIRALADQAQGYEVRLRSILRNLRVPPPEPGVSGVSALAAVHTTIEEHLQRQENTLMNIEGLISELQGLIG